jgi:hypothetical protein
MENETTTDTPLWEKRMVDLTVSDSLKTTMVAAVLTAAVPALVMAGGKGTSALCKSLWNKRKGRRKLASVHVIETTCTEKVN